MESLCVHMKKGLLEYTFIVRGGGFVEVRDAYNRNIIMLIIIILLTRVRC